MAHWSFFHRAFAALLLLVTALVPALPAAAACAGWTASPVQRMACCSAGEGHCAALSADDCCADRESRQHVEIAVAIIVAAAPVKVGQLVPQEDRVRSPLTPPATYSRRDTYLLDSVFLI